jgi:cobalt-zinc-cadmium efflux system protein
MILFAIVGTIINIIAAYVTKEGDSLNQKAVNLHMLEDVLGWIVVLAGAIVIKLTDFTIIDPILSIMVSVYILTNALKSLRKIVDLFLQKTPNEIEIEELTKHIKKIKNVEGIHHIHIWSMDGINNYATMHIVTNTNNTKELKQNIKEELNEHGISHTTIEIETTDECCNEEECHIIESSNKHHHHH